MRARFSAVCARISLPPCPSLSPLPLVHVSVSHAGEDDGVLDPEHLRDAEADELEWRGEGKVAVLVGMRWGWRCERLGP